MDPGLPPVQPSSTRKVRFAPKPPPRRAKNTELKTEASQKGVSDAVVPSGRLLRRLNEHLGGRKSNDTVKKEVQFVFPEEGASSAPTRRHLIPGDENTDGSTRLDGSADGEKSMFVNDENMTKKKREYKEPWDYKNSYYPITLPLRRPYAGDPEILDEAEFGEATRNKKYDESKSHASSELGLEDGDEPRLIFFQLPNNLPLGRRDMGVQFKTPTAKGKEVVEAPTSAKGKEKVENQTAGQRSSTDKGCSLKELPSGHMGKMLVYKSGAVKMKLGGILYDVSPGTQISCPQHVVAINTMDKSCSKVGDVESRAVVTPDIDALLASVLDLD
ncbi:unnamed protein product [Cuscuta epithymum]|uniref:DNA-directed RNA polymerase III subunit RPC4 n=1 Tax=Cuscuta epithymum TaxID=186058 RepID=A0AAV0ECP2_9ASTE|nr:unnamed protein product [Cuscuta epithymum]